MPIKIKDLLGEDKLSDLDWLDNFNHAYSGSVVKDALINGKNFTVGTETYIDAIIYPLISYKRQWFYDSNSATNTNTDSLVNIAYHNDDAGIISGNLKPAIKLHLIIDAISEKYGLNFNSPFFDLGEFKSIYVNLNKTTDSLSAGLDVVETTSGTYNPFNSQMVCEYIMTVTPDAGFEDIPYKIKLTVNDQVYHETYKFYNRELIRGVQVTKYLIKVNMI